MLTDGIELDRRNLNLEKLCGKSAKLRELRKKEPQKDCLRIILRMERTVTKTLVSVLLRSRININKEEQLHNKRNKIRNQFTPAMKTLILRQVKPKSWRRQRKLTTLILKVAPAIGPNQDPSRVVSQNLQLPAVHDHPPGLNPDLSPGPDPNQLPAANQVDQGPGQRPPVGQPVLPVENQTQIRQDMAPEEKLHYHQFNYPTIKKFIIIY